MQMRDREGLDASYLGGAFDRQVRMDDWDQRKVEQQAVLVLGVGGLGSAVALNLLRLGVGRLFLLDYDVVDLHNLNRQLLYSRPDVGKPKVEAAAANAAFHTAGNTQIETFHGNALTNWDKVVDFARRSTFVYNCIDWGDKFDAAVSALCLQLGLPLVMGGTFAVSLTVDFYPERGSPCFVCLDDTTRRYERILDITPERIMEYKDVSFLPRNNNPVGRSSVVVCTLCAELMVSHFLNWLFLLEKPTLKTSRIMFYHNTIELMKFEDLELCRDCPFCAKYHPPVQQKETPPSDQPPQTSEGTNAINTEVIEGATVSSTEVKEATTTNTEEKQEASVEAVGESKPAESPAEQPVSGQGTA